MILPKFNLSPEPTPLSFPNSTPVLRVKYFPPYTALARRMKSTIVLMIGSFNDERSHPIQALGQRGKYVRGRQGNFTTRFQNCDCSWSSYQLLMPEENLNKNRVLAFHLASERNHGFPKQGIDLMQIWRLLISINWISSTKEMNPITRLRACQN